MKNTEQCDLEVLAEIGKLLVAELDGRDELARAIFNTLATPLDRRGYPYLKILTNIVLGKVRAHEEETKAEMIARIQGPQFRPRTFAQVFGMMSGLPFSKTKTT